MNIAWSTIVIIVLFLPPGLIAIRRYFHSINQIPTETRIIGAMTITTILAAISHFITLSLVLLIKKIIYSQIPLPNLNFFYCLFIADGTLINQFPYSIMSSLQHWWKWFVGYYIISTFIGYSLGHLYASIVSILSVKPEEELFFTGEYGDWTFVDVLTRNGVLYKGIFHSEFAGSVSNEAYLCITLASKKVIDQSVPSEFSPVKYNVRKETLYEKFEDYLDSESGPNVLEYITKNDENEWADAFMNFLVWESSPQIVIPRNEIVNLNLRHFNFQS